MKLFEILACPFLFEEIIAFPLFDVKKIIFFLNFS